MKSLMKEKAEKVEQTVLTGSRAAGRSVSDTAVPIDIISAESATSALSAYSKRGRAFAPAALISPTLVSQNNSLVNSEYRRLLNTVVHRLFLHLLPAL